MVIGHPQVLWAGDEEAQISKMREIWNQLKEKPEWLTWEDINNYADKMGVVELPSTRDNVAEKEIQDMLDRNYEKKNKVGLDEDCTEAIEEELKVENEEDYDIVKVYQLKEPGECGYGFMPYDYAEEKFSIDDYELVAEVPVNKVDDSYEREILENVFAFGNTDRNFFKYNPKARSVSVSDVLEYKNKKYYVDSIGFVEINENKLEEANINTNTTGENLSDTKEELQKQLNNIKEIETTKKEIEDKVGELLEGKYSKDDFGPYYVKCFDFNDTDMDTIDFDNEMDACKYAEENTKNGNYKEIGVYFTKTDECLYLYNDEEDETLEENKAINSENYEKLEEDNFPSTDATKKELTPIELRKVKLVDYLTDEQKDYIIKNVDTIENVQNHLEKLGNYYAQFRDDFQEEEIISIDEYIDAYKNEFKKGIK